MFVTIAIDQQQQQHAQFFRLLLLRLALLEMSGKYVKNYIKAQYRNGSSQFFLLILIHKHFNTTSLL